MSTYYGPWYDMAPTLKSVICGLKQLCCSSKAQERITSNVQHHSVVMPLYYDEFEHLCDLSPTYPVGIPIILSNSPLDA